MREWLSLEVFAQCVGASTSKCAVHYEPHLAAMAFYSIDTPRRAAFYLPNIGHESQGFNWATELWGPTETQKRYERDFAQPWPSTAAEARLPRFESNKLAFGLGNVQRGDGSLFRGHGDMQITGRYNHMIVTKRLRERFSTLGVPDFEVEPKKLAEPQWAALAAADYVDMKAMNIQADAGAFDAYCDLINFGRVTAAEGDSNGWEDRLSRAQAAAAALGITLSL